MGKSRFGTSMRNKHSYVIYWFLTLILDVTSATLQSDFVDSLVDSSVYNKRERPDLSDGRRTHVEVSMFINSISAISEIDMDFKINVFLRQIWTDPRLSFSNNSEFNSSDYLVLDNAYKGDIWLPDLYIANEAEDGKFHTLTVPNVLLRLSPDGGVYYSQRISTTLSCNMVLRKFPMDTQICAMKMESYGHTTDDIDFGWHDGENSVQVNTALQLPEFNLTKFEVGDCTAVFVTGGFSCIYVNLQFTRELEFYMTQLYVPSIMVVIISWVAFWIDAGAVPARVTIGVITVLTTTTQATGITNKLPKVSYTKAIDVWMFTAVLFVFAALLEFALVNVLARRQRLEEEEREKIRKREEKATRRKLTDRGFGEITKTLTEIPPGWEAVERKGVKADGSVVTIELKKIKEQVDEERAPKRSRSPLVRFFNKVCACLSFVVRRMYDLQQKRPALFVDTMSRVVFPTAYVIFNAIYWPYYYFLDDENLTS